MQLAAAMRDSLSRDQPAEAERLLDHSGLRSSESNFQLGNSAINTYAFLSSWLIDAYLRRYDYSNAKRVVKDRLTWAETQSGPQSWRVGGYLSHLAYIDRLELRYEDAKPLYLRSLAIQRSLKLDNCLIAKEVYTGLAETYIALRLPRDAEELLKPAIDECQQKFGGHFIALPDLLNAYAVALENDKQPDEAGRVALEADRAGKPISPRFQEQFRDFMRGRLLASQGRFDEAVSLCRKWIAIFEVPDGPESDRRLLIPLAECERLLRLAGRDAEAAKVGARLKALRTKYDEPFQATDR